MYFIKIFLIVLILMLLIFVFFKIKKDEKKVNNRLTFASCKMISDLQISSIINHSFFIDRENSLQTLMRICIEKDYLYIYFSSNISISYTNGPFIICNDNSSNSDFWAKYYIKKIERLKNGVMKLVFSTRNSVLFSEYNITIKYINEEDFELIKENIL